MCNAYSLLYIRSFSNVHMIKYGGVRTGDPDGHNFFGHYSHTKEFSTFLLVALVVRFVAVSC